MISIFGALQIFFSPLGGCEAQIVKDISHAKQSVLMQAYSLTSKPIFAALIADHKRGIDVQIIIDGEPIYDQNHQQIGWQTSSPNWPQLVAAGIDLRIDTKHAIAHNKIIIIDAPPRAPPTSPIILTGSFNFTFQAEHANAENLIRITGNPVAAKQYVENFLAHAAHSVPAVATP